MQKVLLAEDDPGIAELYAKKIALAGFAVVVAADGEETLAKASEEAPDIILLDVMMPKMDGMHALAELKKRARTKNIPVIFLTNLGGRLEDIDAARELGAEDLIVKAQVTPREVVAKVREILARRAAAPA